MRVCLMLFFCGFLFGTSAQTLSEKTLERKGFIFGTSVGLSTLKLNFTGQPTQRNISLSLPNFKVGAMISKRTALVLYLPGTIYTYKLEGRQRDRGFEAIIPSVQYWLKDRFWLLGGVGIGMDAPVFYDIKDETERVFYFGSAAIAGVGYELWHNKKMALDLQSRVHYGTANFPDGKRDGLAFSFLVGLNWY